LKYDGKSEPQITHFSAYVGGFPNAEKKDLLKFVGDYKLKGSRFLKKKKGVAFVNFSSAEDVDAFVKKNGSSFQGSEILVKYAQTNLPSCHVSGYPDDFTEAQMKQFVGAKKKIAAIRFLGEDNAYAFVDFKTIVSCNQFLKKNGTKFSGETITIKLARGGDRSASASVFIGNLPDSVSEKALKKFLGGDIEVCRIVEDKNIAFVAFASVEDATKAKAKNGSKFKGKEILITTKNRKQRKQSDGSL